MVKKWDEEEIDFIKKMAKKLSITELSRKLNRSYNSILKKASKENISFRNNSWSQKDITFLKKNMGINLL